jgi:hypothetical protein
MFSDASGFSKLGAAGKIKFFKAVLRQADLGQAGVFGQVDCGKPVVSGVRTARGISRPGRRDYPA